MPDIFTEPDLPMDTSAMIPLAGDVDLKVFAADCYALSFPHGHGQLHYRTGPMPAEVMPAVNPRDRIALIMDYVLGRCVKMCVYRYEGRLWIDNPWYRHTDADLVVLCARHAEDRARYRELLAQPGAAWPTNSEGLSPLGGGETA